MTLGEYLKNAGALRHVYGVHDCCTFAADWCIDQGWPDPMADWRGGYIDAAPADNGLLPIFAAGMDGAGLRAVSYPLEGDCAVISVFGMEAGAIFTGKRWALVAPRGLVFVSADPSIVLKIWRVL